MKTNSKRRVSPSLKLLTLALAGIGVLPYAQAMRLDTGADWDTSLNTTVQYTMGWRTQGRNSGIANNPSYDEGDYKFDKGDMVTNRVNALVELQGVYKRNTGYRISASAWKDFAYDDDVETNPAFANISSYRDDEYSSTTKKFHMRGAELIDAFVFHNTRVGDTSLYLKAGRFTEYWGNAFFFGFSNIGYSQHPIDYLKSFSAPGTEVKELFMPRAQVMATTELSPELSVTAQYFFEFRPNRFPEGGTYLGPFDFLYSGPNQAPSLGFPVSAGHENKPDDINDNFGIKVSWSPEWAQGDLGFYFRQFDEVQPSAFLDVYANGTGRVHQEFVEKVKLYGFSYETNLGPVSTGIEFSYRQDTGLASPISNGQTGVYDKGATGDIANLIVNGLYTLPSTPLWDTGALLAELSYTRLVDVTGNEELYNGVGEAGCGFGSKSDGCATRNALAVAVLFEPAWLQVFPSIDLSAPMSLTYGINGNPAYNGGAFYAEGTQIYSAGIRATYKQIHSATLQYNGYHWDAKHKDTDYGAGLAYSGGNGPIGLNDKGWIELQLKTSF
ncbi:DUF1302 domain-containing protein [Stutzerimonas stutzeri]|uniref:DUF1302 family protein n=1 Tax=Stutzerimonas stutzeri TaxID=316 RepID=A0A6I6LRR0_STUST|nr:DUF1302 family protein [Stutzerimonas stutzeri]QGZ31195.1 DUF1302 family protein [Stutzerimonas stutzeri]